MADVPMTSRPMTPGDLATVSQLGIASKRSWGYDPQQMSVFANELTLSPDAFAGLFVAEVACLGREIVGYYTIRQHADGIVELEHLFVAPERFHQGIGRMLFRNAINQAAVRGVAKLTIIADPNSAGFYERLGAKKTGDHQSSIPGRIIPIYEVATGTHHV
jgi:ribosomal protein S18 acetylase RimI-like enzyme